MAAITFCLLCGMEPRRRADGWGKFRRENIAAECLTCGRKSHLELHHVVPISRGGEELDAENVRTLCDFCHTVWGHFGNDRDGYNLDLDADAKSFRQRVAWRATGGREPARAEQ
jgi:5-methylcytosine-specific restriction endonuclease McrA